MTLQELIEEARNFVPTPEQVKAFYERANEHQKNLDSILDSLPPQVS